jgi:hypothetical protein
MPRALARLRWFRLTLLMLAAVAAFAALAVDASGGGYLDAIHNVDLSTNAKGTGITFVSWTCGKYAFATTDPLRHPLKINGTLSTAKRKSGKPQKFTAYPVNV